MNSSHNTIDYVVSKKATGSNLLLRILFILLYAAVGIGIFAFAVKLAGWLGIVAGGILAPFLMYILFSLTWRHVAYELKYQIYTPTANLNEVPHTVIELDKMKLNNKKETVPHVVYKREMRDADLIAPYVPENKDKYASSDVKKVIDFRSKASVTKDCYFLRFPEKDGSKTVIIVEAVNKVVSAFKYHNKDVTEVAELSR